MQQDRVDSMAARYRPSDAGRPATRLEDEQDELGVSKLRD